MRAALSFLGSYPYRTHAPFQGPPLCMYATCETSARNGTIFSIRALEGSELINANDCHTGRGEMSGLCDDGDDDTDNADGVVESNPKSQRISDRNSGGIVLPFSIISGVGHEGTVPEG